jgi:hypothetical protein
MAAWRISSNRNNNISPLSVSSHPSSTMSSHPSLTIKRPYSSSSLTRPYSSSSLTRPYRSSSVTRPYPPSSVTGPYPPSSVTGPYPPSSVTGPYPPSSVTGPYPPSSVTRPYPPSSVTRPYPPSSVTGPYPPSSVTGPYPLSSVTKSRPLLNVSRLNMIKFDPSVNISQHPSVVMPKTKNNFNIGDLSGNQKYGHSLPKKESTSLFFENTKTFHEGNSTDPIKCQKIQPIQTNIDYYQCKKTSNNPLKCDKTFKRSNVDYTCSNSIYIKIYDNNDPDKPQLGDPPAHFVSITLDPKFRSAIALRMSNVAIKNVIEEQFENILMSENSGFFNKYFKNKSDIENKSIFELVEIMIKLEYEHIEVASIKAKVSFIKTILRFSEPLLAEYNLSGKTNTLQDLFNKINSDPNKNNTTPVHVIIGDNGKPLSDGSDKYKQKAQKYKQKYLQLKKSQK